MCEGSVDAGSNQPRLVERSDTSAPEIRLSVLSPSWSGPDRLDQRDGESDGPVRWTMTGKDGVRAQSMVASD